MATTARIDVDHPAVARWATRGLAVLALTAFIVGAPALVEVGAWAGLGWAAWGVPVVVDLGLVIGAVSATVARQRQAPAGLLWAGTAALVLLSTLAQGVHAWTRADVDGPARWVAIALGALPPLAVLWSTEALIRLIVSEPVRRAVNQVAQEAPALPDRPGRPEQQVAVGGRAGVEPAPARRAAPAAPERRSMPEISGTGDRGELVRQALELRARGLSMRATADELGVARASLSRWIAEASAAEPEAA